MSIRYFDKTFSQANAVTTGTSSLVFGPIPVDWLDNFAIHIRNYASSTINFRVRVSIDQQRDIEDNFPLGSFTNTQALAVGGNESVVRTLYGDSNPFKYISVFASATTTIGSTATILVLTGRAQK